MESEFGISTVDEKIKTAKFHLFNKLTSLNAIELGATFINLPTSRKGFMLKI